MTWIKQTQNAFYNFFAPDIAADADQKIEVVFPTVEALNPSFAATQPVDIKRQCTVIDLGALTGACTLDATISDHVGIGAVVHVKVASDTSARALTLGTGFTAPAIAGVISKTKVQSFIYNGTTFLPLGASLQID